MSLKAALKANNYVDAEVDVNGLPVTFRVRRMSDLDVAAIISLSARTAGMDGDKACPVKASQIVDGLNERRVMAFGYLIGFKARDSDCFESFDSVEELAEVLPMDAVEEILGVALRFAVQPGNLADKILREDGQTIPKFRRPGSGSGGQTGQAVQAQPSGSADPGPEGT
jgi:hypothetical protein